MGARISEELAIAEGWYRPNTNNGLCMCGCGEETAISTGTRRVDGVVIGCAKRFIKGHYSLYTAEQKVLNGEAECRYCHTVKDLSEFGWVETPTRRGGYYRERCNTCYSLYHAKYHYATTYGMSLEDYDAMLQSQSGGCAICQIPISYKRHAVDHDHLTNQIRGLLCDKCNRGLGMFEDDIDRLFAAAAYLLTKSGLHSSQL